MSGPYLILVLQLFFPFVATTGELHQKNMFEKDELQSKYIKGNLRLYYKWWNDFAKQGRVCFIKKD